MSTSWGSGSNRTWFSFLFFKIGFGITVLEGDVLSLLGGLTMYG